MISFKGATININAFSDVHGRVENCAAAYQTFEDNKTKMFLPEKRGNKNLLLVPGDWFMAGGTKGYLSDTSATSQDFQLRFLNKFVCSLNKFAKNIETYFVIGNHDADSGPKKLSETLSKLLVKATICTNMDPAKSRAFAENIRRKELVKSKIVSVSDDTQLFKRHKMLILGLSPVNMSYYNEKTDEMGFIDDVKKPQISLKSKDYEKTIEDAQKEIEKFKAKNPKGVVVLMNHGGSKISAALARKSGNINLILDGHEHKDAKTTKHGAKIIGLSKDFEKIENIKIALDDNGDVLRIKTKKYKPDKNVMHFNEMGQYFKNIFAPDLKQTFNIDACCNIAELTTKDVRKDNNNLANFVTDIVLKEIQKIDPSVEIFGINASAIRKGLPTSLTAPANRLDLMLVLNGLKTENANVFTNEVSGKELIDIIAANLKFNEIDPEKNPLMHYSGLIIVKQLADLDIKTVPPDELRHYVIVEKTGAPIDLDKKYKIANVEKWLTKSEYQGIAKLKKEAMPINANAKELFMGHFENLFKEKSAPHIYAQKQYRYVDIHGLPQANLPFAPITS